MVLKELQKRNDVRRRLEVVMRRNDLQTTPNPNVERRQQRTMQRQQQQLNNISNINNINNIYPPRAKSAENFGGIAANFAKFGNPKFNSGGIASDSNSLGLHYRNNAASNVDANSKSVDEGMLLNILQNSNTARSNKSDGDDGNSNKTNLRDMFQRPSEDEQKKKKKRRKKKKKAKGSDDEQQNKPTTHPVTIPMPMASPISSRLSPTSLLWYMKSELFGGDDDTFEDDDDDDFDSENKANERDWRIIDDNISNFMSVPASLEKLMSFGFGVSIDAFLNVIVVVPIQVRGATSHHITSHHINQPSLQQFPTMYFFLTTHSSNPSRLVLSGCHHSIRYTSSTAILSPSVPPAQLVPPHPWRGHNYLLRNVATNPDRLLVPFHSGTGDDQAVRFNCHYGGFR